MDSAYIPFRIAVLSDATTNQPTEVEVPLLGKIKSNYPALLFVFLAAALALLTMISAGWLTNLGALPSTAIRS